MKKIEQMLRKSPQGRRWLEKYSHDECTWCGQERADVYECGNCEQKFCQECETDAKKKVITELYLHMGELGRSAKRCKGQYTFACTVHSERSFSNELTPIQMFDHLVGEPKCSTPECRAKKMCPRCKLQVKYQTCLHCVKDEHFCKPCIKGGELHWCNEIDDDEAPTNTWQVICPDRRTPFPDFNPEKVRYLCRAHHIAMTPLIHQESDPAEKWRPAKGSQSTCVPRKRHTILD